MSKDNIKSTMQNIEQQAGGSALSGMKEKKQPDEFMKDFDQSKDADLSDIKLGGKHFLIKAPDRKTDSGLILSEKQQKQLQSVTETPGFQEDVTVQLTSNKCELVEEGDMVLLNPHVNTMEAELPAIEQDPETDEVDKVLYIMIHEDYVLMAKPSE